MTGGLEHAPVVTANDWPEVDSNISSFPSNVSDSDLFGSDLFGGDLMEMYSDAASTENGDNASVMSLLSPSLLQQVNEIASSSLCDDASSNNSSENETSSNSFLNDISDILNGKSTQTHVPAEPNVQEPHAPEPHAPEPHVQDVTMDLTPPATEIPTSKKISPLVPAPVLVPIKKPKNNAATGKRKSSNISALASAPNAITRQAAAYKKQQGQKMGCPVDGSGSASPTNILGNNVISPLTISAQQVKSAPIPSNPKMTPIARIPSHLLQLDSATAIAATIAAQATSPPPPTVPSTNLNTNRSESDFTAVAQAAVSSLIMSAGSNAAAYLSAKNSRTPDAIKKVDTSTAHIAALTSPNWMAACSSTFNPSIPTSSNIANPMETITLTEDPDPSKKGNRCAILSADERAKQNRVRNREHARNTRLRKKAYVEELKRTLTELVTQRDAAEMESRLVSQRDLEQREVRFRVMEEFLKLRGSNEQSVGRWVAILEEGFVLTMPRTDYRGMVHPTNQADQVLRGASECMKDAGLLKNMLGKVTPLKINMVHDCNRKNFFMDGSTAVLYWTANIAVADIGHDQTFEFTLKGSMKSIFSPASNKLLSSNIIFDTGVVKNYLKQFHPISIISPPPPIQPIVNIARNAAAVATSHTLTPKEADALLDSIQMPFLTGIPISANNNTHLHPAAPVSVTSSEKSDCSSDEKDLEEMSMEDIVGHPHRQQTGVAIKTEME